MWAAFKLLPFGAKLGLFFGILAMFAATIGSTAYVFYNKGLNVSKVEIQSYETKVAKLDADLKSAQNKVDVKVITEYKDHVSYIDRTVYKTRDIVIENVPEQFNLSKGWIYVYNQSVLGFSVDPELAADTTPSTVSEMLALANTIIPNNGICLTNKTKLEKLQEWVISTEKSYEEINNSN